MKTENVKAALTGAAQALHTAARAHKTAEAQHRRQARALSRQLDLLRRVAESYGIDIHIDTDPRQ
jgi:hypothetical protein